MGFNPRNIAEKGGPVAGHSAPRQAVTRGAHRPSWGLVDLFSGCGGASCGFLSTQRFVPLYAADNDPWANDTYEVNLGHKPQGLDLRALEDEENALSWAEEIRRRSPGKLALVGGPPCQGFSSHVKMKGDRHGRNTLVGTFARLAVALRPEAVLLENVPDLFSDRSWPLFLEFRQRLEGAGYCVRARIVNMAQLGVPQERFRAVVIARPGESPTYPAVRIPRPEDYSTVKEWIGELPPVASGETDPLDPMHEASRHRESTLAIIRQVPKDGGGRPPGVGPDCLQRARNAYGGYTDVYGRLAWSSPAPTITARCRTPSCGRFVHPEQDRGLTAREAALLQTFPPTWNFSGPFDDRFKQIGNAVPPMAAQAFADHIADGFSATTEEVGLAEITDSSIGASFSVLIPGIRRRGGVL